MESKLQSYYKLTLRSGSEYQVIDADGHPKYYSDVTMTARGLAEDSKALLEMIVERAKAARTGQTRSEMEPPSQIEMDRALGL